MKPRYLVLGPIGLFFGLLLVEMGLLAKHVGGINPIVYHRALGIFVVGLALAALGFQVSRKLFRRS